jgi:hypothetical protein
MEVTNKPTQPLQNKGNNMEMKNQNENIYKGTILVLVIIIGVLTFMLITGRQALKDVSTERTIADELNLELRNELNNVLEEYNIVKMEYDSVLTKQDSVIQANAREIERLIAQQGDYHRIRRQLNLLREITQNYVHEIDSLYTENRVLKAENIEMQQEIQRVTRRTTELTETKEALEGKVEVASALRAFQINATPIRLRGSNREEETDRARRTDRIRVCFTVAENPVANPGNKNAYVRIADPSGNILRLGDDDRYAFTIGQDTLQFSMRGQFNYINQDTNVCMYWDKQNDFDEGIYLVSVFTDEFRLGESQFSLR